VAVLRNDHEALKAKVNDDDRGLEAAYQRLDNNDKLAVSVGIAISIGRWLLVTFGALVALLLFNLLTRSIEIVWP